MKSLLNIMNDSKPAPATNRPAIPMLQRSEGDLVLHKSHSRVPSREISADRDLAQYNWSLISGVNSIIPVSHSMRKSIAVLDIHTDPKQCVIIAKKESYGDTVFNETVLKAREIGYYVLEACLADSGFLSKIYEQTTSAEAMELDPESSSLVEALDNELILVAMERGASDIHIELRENSVNVCMREDGELQPGTDWGYERTQRLIRVLFMLADEKTKDTTLSEDRGQSMSIKRVIKGLTVKLRVQTETAYPMGKDIVMRVLLEGVDAKVKTLEQLGYSRGHLTMLTTMLSSPTGAIIVAGTTGSGKSTTLQTMMHDIRASAPGIKMYSIEDPPEYILKGVTQIPVRSSTKSSEGVSDSPYADTMRNAMRMDPDVIMVGELRDKISVELFTGMVQSGHKVLTTLHAASAFGILGRLAKMDLDISVAADRDFISGLIYQKLVPLLCPHCKKKYDPYEWSDYSPAIGDELNPNIVSKENLHETKKGKLGLPGIHDRIHQVERADSTIFVRGDGCNLCKGGVKGRTVCAEMVLPSNRMRAFLREGKVNEAFEAWQKLKRPGRENEDNVSAMAGMTALDHALSKMRVGLLSPSDVEASLGFLTGYDADDGIMDDASSDLLGLGR